MKIRRLIVTIALLVGLLAGGLGGLMAPVPEASANPCAADASQSIDGNNNDNNSVTAAGGGNGDGDDCNVGGDVNEG